MSDWKATEGTPRTMPIAEMARMVRQIREASQPLRNLRGARFHLAWEKDQSGMMVPRLACRKHF